MNVPNMLSLLRICLVPVFILVYFMGGDHRTIWAALIYAAASLTDVLDGKIARKYNMTTNLGKILDPMGDKLMTASVIVCITIDHVIPVWAVIVFVVKEALMGLGGLIVYKKLDEMPPSNYFGKASTVVFFAVCVILMLFRQIPSNVATIMISAALLVMLLAFGTYLFRFIRIVREKDRTKN